MVSSGPFCSDNVSRRHVGCLGGEPARRELGLGPELLDCHWCGSARSIEFGICQVCLMEYPMDTKVIVLPSERTVELDEPVTSELVSGDD